VNPELEAAVERARLAVDSLYAALVSYDAGEDTEETRATLRNAAGTAGADVGFAPVAHTHTSLWISFILSVSLSVPVSLSLSLSLY
jgi:hypothetical protein